LERGLSRPLAERGKKLRRASFSIPLTFLLYPHNNETNEKEEISDDQRGSCRSIKGTFEY
jgi:hypothetical protein